MDSSVGINRGCLLKPIGFIWTIRAIDGHEGILMGSMHITAEKLVNFPSKIMELFDSSDAMAVEIDISREDVVKRCHEEVRLKQEVSWKKTQAQELQKLSLAEKEGLFQFLKTQHPDLVVDSTDEFDAQTEFLIQALRKMILQRVKTTNSRQKGKATNLTTGIDKTLMKRAKEKKIPIKDLETFEDHFFSTESSSSLPNASYEEMKEMIAMPRTPFEDALIAYIRGSSDIQKKTDGDLMEMLPKNPDKISKLFLEDPLQKITDMMEMGDLDALEELYLADSDPSSRANTIQRNQNMAMKIGEFMKSGKKHFCVAGAMHMAGPSSILSFLKEAGYTVERLIVEEPLES